MATSAVVLFLHLVLASGISKRLATRLFSSNKKTEESSPVHIPVDERSHIAQLGGRVIFGFIVARLLSCLALLGLSVVTLVLHHKGGISRYESHDWLQIALCGTYVSPSCYLSYVTISRKRRR